jgi:hypothetical protein
VAAANGGVGGDIEVDLLQAGVGAELIVDLPDFVPPLETAKCKMMNAKCKSGRCAWGLAIVVVCGILLLACFVCQPHSPV